MLQVLKDHKEFKVRQEQTVLMVLMVLPVLKVQQEHKESKVLLELQARKVRPERMVPPAQLPALICRSFSTIMTKLVQ